MRVGAILLGLGWLSGACGGTVVTSDPQQTSSGSMQGVSAAGATSSAGVGECAALSNTSDAGLGACSVARALVQCTSSQPNSGTCECLSDDPTTCAFCRQQLTGTVTCVSRCAADEYAMACGGPPIVNGDGTGGGYRSAPPMCADLGYTPAGSEFACCPCQ